MVPLFSVPDSLAWIPLPILVLAGFAILILGLYAFVRFSNLVRYIPNDEVGIVEKLWSRHGSVQTGFIARRGEAGFQPKVLRGGIHFFFPFQYRVHREDLVTIPQGQIGYIFARDGVPLAPTQTLAKAVGITDYSDAEAFLAAGGQRGPQRQILRDGTYAVNLAQFVVITKDVVHSLELGGDDALLRTMAKVIEERAGFAPVVIRDKDDQLGIVTVHDGPSLAPNEIIAPTVGTDPAEAATYHNDFQDPERFLVAGGRRGRQLQVLVEGTYYLNRLFATVELIPKTVIEVGTVGVVVSYTGPTAGPDISGPAYRHGELVEAGQRGVWKDPLLPGKYAFNTYAGKVSSVPTTNFVLKWIKAEASVHKLDENLAEVDLITKDAFEPTLPLSVVVHIDYQKAPLVIQRFGDIKKLVEQTLDPMVSAYFKNIAQTRTLIELIQERSLIQQQSGVEMKARFTAYDLELQEVLIGTPGPGKSAQTEQILEQLRSRQVAVEQVETYNRQEAAATKERELREAESRAKQQASITESEISIRVQENQGKAELARAQQKASEVRTLAEAERDRIQLVAAGDAERAARVGIAQALAIEEQVRAYGGPRFQLTQQVMARFSEAIENSKVDVVPKILIGGGNGHGEGIGGTGGVLETLLALVLSDRLGVDVSSAPPTPRAPAAEAIRREIMGKVGGTGKAGI